MVDKLVYYIKIQHFDEVHKIMYVYMDFYVMYNVM